MMNKRIIFITAAMIVLLAVCVAGCSKKKAEAPKAVETKPQVAAASAQSETEEPRVEKETITYNAEGRRDPFLSLAIVVKPVRRPGAKPIENFDVAQIKLLAILWDSQQQYYAMVRLPDGKSFTVRKGIVLGLYGGRVEEISKDKVVIREQVKDVRGDLKTKDTILRLRKEEVE